MKNYDKNIELSYLMYLDANNLYGWAMSQKLVVDGLKWIKELSKIDECFIKNYNGNSDKGYILEVEVEYPKNLFNLDRDLPVLSKRKKIKKCNKLSCSRQDKEKYVVHIREKKH